MADVLYEVLEKLGHVKKTGRSWMARCPAHEDSEPSLSVSEGDSQPVILKCHAMCSTESVVSALGMTMADLMAPREEVRPVVDRYPYVSAEGELLMEVVVARGAGKKQVHREPAGVTDLPLYRLPDVLHAVTDGEPIVVVEGEKDAESVVRAGMVATTSGAVGTWRPAHTASLKGASSVLVIADADRAGINHARSVGESLRTAGIDVTLTIPTHRPSNESKYDISDQLGAGYPLDDLDDLPWAGSVPDPGPKVPRITGLRVLTRDELDSIPPPQWLVDGLVTTGFSVIYGASGAYKSFLALDWGCHVATGTSWFSRPCLSRKVLYVAAEGTAGIPRRVNAWEYDRRHRAADLMLIPQVVNMLAPGDVNALAMEIEDREVGMLVVDTLARSMPGGDENAAQDMGRLVHALSELQTHTAVVVIHHTGVDGKRPRGSTALFGAADTVVRCDGGNGTLKVSCDKQKDDDSFAPWQLRLKPVRESVVLSLAGGGSADDKIELVRAALADGVAMAYADLVRLVGGDGELILMMDSYGQLARHETGDRVRYTLANEEATA